MITYSPLDGGLLTGKYGTGRPDSGRLVDNPRDAGRYGLDSDHATAAPFTAFAEKAGVRPATLAVAWAMTHPAVTAPTVGALACARAGHRHPQTPLDLTVHSRRRTSHHAWSRHPHTRGRAPRATPGADDAAHVRGDHPHRRYVRVRVGLVGLPRHQPRRRAQTDGPRVRRHR
ncbi:aldo/keto reductase [Saccharomonospora sp. NPDC046836]|uniref:aldo/keto reductase n=1 Tax=Saccharomonospora sp. NPDC046836 TaxID=3156921 RepID=UPI0033C67177